MDEIKDIIESSLKMVFNIGMRVNIAVRHDFEIGENVITGVSTLVNKSVPLENTCVNILARLINKD